MWAVAQRQSAVVEALLEGGADVNAGSKTGFTPLMFAAQTGDADTTRILLRAGAKPNDPQPKTSLTPLMIASAMAHADAVEVLLDKGANPDLVDKDGYSALHRVVRDSDYGVNPASKEAVLTIVKSLLKHGANPNIRLSQDREKAAEEIKNGAVQQYEKRSAVTVNEIILQGATPIFLAAEVNNLDVIKALVAAGGDPLLATERGTTPLMMAAGGGTDVQRERSLEERATAVESAILRRTRRRRERRGAVRVDRSARGGLSGPERRHRLSGQQGRTNRSEGRVRADGVEHFAVRPHAGYRRPPPSDSAPVPPGDSRAPAEPGCRHARKDGRGGGPPAQRRPEPGESRHPGDGPIRVSALSGSRPVLSLTASPIRGVLNVTR
jgi:ankyrin repeat protein